MMFGFFRKKRVRQYSDAALRYVEKNLTHELQQAQKNDENRSYRKIYSDRDLLETRLALPSRKREDDSAIPNKEQEEQPIRFSRKPICEKVNLSQEDLNALRTSFANVLTGKLTFVDKLLLYSREKNMSSAAIYRAAGIDRRLYSKIISNRNYKPSKDTAIAVALALNLDLTQATELLGLAGYTFSHSDKRDVIIEYFISERIYKLVYINEVLYCLDQKIIGR